MTPSSLEQDVLQVCNLIRTRQVPEGRTMIAIAGPPASGKSTLADRVVQALNVANSSPIPEAVVIPMDGYHLDNDLLESRGLLTRKGAPETFNSIGFCEAIDRVSFAKREMFFPKFDRKMDLSIAQSIVVHPDTPIIVVEGNYLLLNTSPWDTLRELFHATIFTSPSRDAILERLMQRWLKHGLDKEAALLRAQSNDMPNADLVLKNSRSADLHLHQNYSEFGVRYAF